MSDKLSDLLRGSLRFDPGTPREPARDTTRFSGWSRVDGERSFNHSNLVKRVEVPQYGGDYNEYHSWREAFDRLVDTLQIPPDFKMLHLKKSLTDEAKGVLTDLGCSEISYTVAMQRLERKYGGERRRTDLHMDEIHKFRPVRPGSAVDLEKFAELLDVVVVDLVESGSTHNWGGTYLYRTLQQKLNEDLINAYRKWLREYRNPPNVESLRLFVMEESEDQVAMLETFKGVITAHSKKSDRAGPSTRHRTHGAAAMLTMDGSASQPERDMSLNCKLCDQRHGLWSCKEFLKLNNDQRWAKAKEYRVCFRCLSRTHRSDKCMRGKQCGIDDCHSYHHRLLHEKKGAPPKKATPGAERAKPAATLLTAPADVGSSTVGSVPVLAARAGQRNAGNISLRIVPVILRWGKRQLRVNTVIDDGSTKTFVNECIATALQLPGEPAPLVVSVINNQRAELDSLSVRVTLVSEDGEVNRNIEAQTVRSVLGDARAVDWSKMKREWPHLQDIPFPELPNDAAIDMLIGLDNVKLHDCLEEYPGGLGAPVARLTPLGWTCVGPVRPASRSRDVQHVLCTAEDTRLSHLVRKMWQVEDVIAIDNMSVDDQTAQRIVRNGMRDCQGHYEVHLPWRTQDCFLPKSRVMAYNRLMQVEKKLKRDPAVAEAYRALIADHLKKGYIEEVPEDEEEVLTPPLAYIPHFAIVKPDATSTKLRVVFDASAESGGVCLNDYLYTGPTLQADIVQVLQRFRRYQVAVGCDVAEMYLQVRLHPSEYNAHRFLWRDLQTDARVRTYRHKSLMFGQRPAPYVAHEVSHKNAEQHEEEFPLAADTVKKATYMDDGMDSCKTVRIAIQLCSELRQLWAHAGMRVHKWLSSSPSVLASLPAEQWAKTMMPGAGESALTKTLGLKWDATEDVFTFTVLPPDPEMAITKRSFLSKTASLYDPLGLICPYVVKARLLLQDMWLSGASWDEALPRELQEAAVAWFEELQLLSQLRVPRALVALRGQVVSTELHTFTDASQNAYGAVTYVVHHYDDGTVTSRLALAKVKIAPLATVSIPRLELMAAVKGLKTAEIIREHVGWEIARERYWTDSLDVICWIRGTSRQYKPFVGNRVGEIHRRSDPDAWHHVPTGDNPADKLSRGVAVADLATDEQWWQGPPFLKQDESRWPPPMGPVKQNSAVIKKEGRQSQFVSLLVKTNTGTKCQVLDWKNSRLHPEHYSKFTRYIRVLAWVRRFTDRARRLPPPLPTGPLSSDELWDVESVVIATAQAEAFGDEIRLLTKSQPVGKTSTLAPLNPVMDAGGLLRGGSRLQIAEQIPWATRYPLILPRDHDVTRLTVQRAHDATNHAGTNYVLANLSVAYWIIAARESIRGYERSCMVCRRRKAQPANQIMAPLPALRTHQTTRAFQHVSVDYAGPFYTRQGRGRVQAKRYVCLFGCLATRAVHLEMAYAMHTDAFLNAFYRMVCRRGMPEEVVSDNGSNFIGGERELRELVEALDWNQVQTATSHKGIRWSFNPPSAPHFNGVHEALVKAAKKAMQGIYRSADINDEELASAICGAEDLLNSQPLTYQSANSQDIPPLTPNHFIMGQMGGRFAPENVDTDDYSVSKRWRHVQMLVREFWSRWLKEWIPSLSPRKKWRQQQPELQVGDVVLVLSADTPRGQWPLGRITATYPGPDGHVRTADVKVRDAIYRRPIVKLCPLEVAAVDPLSLAK